ncbi:hypothetical protein [Nocardia veterana]|uniref:XRE family transcriptional regulator n=1 Tax=Nocardia veterana TaxID=132249 RepID=A0A7X6LZR7_9NOCA|nr:hypothetical protein [Nocardia veterana]NKY87543.1 XRE family transcriptional regulator [Nocardia veterana]
MQLGSEWTGFEAVVLQTVTRQSVREFADRLGVDAKTVSNWRARGHMVRLRPATQQLLDIELARATSDAQELFFQLIAERDVDSPRAPAPADADLGWLGADPSGLQTITTPAGRFFSGSATPVLALPARRDGDRIIATVGTTVAVDPLLHRPRRSLVVATVGTEPEAAGYAVDRRHALAKLNSSGDGAPLLVPAAYRLDPFTTAVLWAVTNLDDALLDDDAELHTATTQLAAPDTPPRPGVGPDLTGAMSAVSQMWLGSHVCARHILGHTDELTQPPVFWSREQRGEEASTWLLFAHKYRYLQTIAQKVSAAETLTRAFCIPPAAVTASPQPERVLLMLTAALIESFAITVAVCGDPEYSATQGFVLDHTRRAIVASWVNSDHIWHVDVTDHRPTLREFTDAAAWARAHSILSGTTPTTRLRSLAGYLELDWTWLTGRARQLADHGVSGFTRPRSRLLSLAGIEQACQFLGDLPDTDR